MKPIFRPVRLSEEERAERLEALSKTIADKRDEAVTARKESGIEKVWEECEDAYLGIDDLNRADYANAKWAKPVSMNGPVTSSKVQSDETRSKAFVRLTSRYVDAGSARLGEILLAIDEKSFSFTSTPIPELIKQKEDLTPILDAAGVVMRPRKPEEIQAQQAPEAVGMPQAQPGQAPQMGAPQMGGQPQGMPQAGQPMVPKTKKDEAEELLKKASDMAEAAEKRIYDWMIECKYNAECRKVIHDAARIGVGVLKGPFPEKSKSQAYIDDEGISALEIVEKISPVVRWIDPWNLFPDGACGENIHHGDYIFERDFMAPRMLKSLIGTDGYIASQIEKVIEEGPDKCQTEGRNPADKVNKKRFDVWYYYGTLTREEMICVNAQGIEDLPEDKEEVFAIVTLVNDSIIRATINPLDSGKFPYHVMAWSRRAGHWAGVGVGEQIAMPQRMCNAATRSMLNNAGKSSGVQLVVDQNAIIPADNKWVITPDKIWYTAPDAANVDVSKAFQVSAIPSVQGPLMNIINYAMKLAEEASNIPLIAQGQTENLPQTFGQAELMNNNANTLLRSIAYAWDDNITEPVVRAYYEWLLLDPTVPNEEKGDFNINAHGSIALVEKSIQEQVITSMGQMVMNPAFGVDPKKWFAEWMRTKRLDPRRMQYTEEEMQKMQSQPPAPPLPVMVEQVKGQNALQLQQAKAQAELQQTQQDLAHEQQMLQNGQATPHMAQATSRIEQERIRAQTSILVEQSRAHAEAARAEKELEIARQNGDFRLKELELKREIAILEYSNQQQISINDAKTALAKSAMDNKTKQQLANAEIQLAQNEGDKNRQLDVQKHAVSLQRDMMSTPNTP